VQPEGGPKSTGVRPHIAEWTQANPGLSILISALLGLVLVVALSLIYKVECASRTNGVCLMIHNNPPWLFVTAAAACPSALLTWFWRTSHKISDLRRGLDDLELGKQRLTDDRGQLAFERLQLAMRLLSGVTSEQLLGIQLERDAIPSLADNWRKSVWHTLNGMVRTTAGVVGKQVVVREAISAMVDRTLFPSSLQLQPDLHGTNLTGADLVRIDLSGADLRDADLSAADLDGANFTQANLAGARLVTARGGTAIFAKSNLRGASLEGADFERVSGLDTADLGGAHYGKNTRLPQGNIPIERGMIEPPDPGNRGT
jgi:uncharacterized protein YjbI with pentapeptide repeats